MQAAAAAPSTEQANVDPPCVDVNVSDADFDLVRLGGPLVTDVSGGVASTVHVRVAANTWSK